MASPSRRLRVWNPRGKGKGKEENQSVVAARVKREGEKGHPYCSTTSFNPIKYSNRKMGSKAFVLPGLLLATVLLITSEVTARDLVETSTPKETSESICV
ncbi:hypothetical protein RHMOL_Rhmol06G0238400 [Rhododendron molle]|uniref:Uncharacterized protein n=1 Tax=Rhododendron molle TaxID=49168 RepID=A0ACC0NFX9_RHOML|nr:hypothetical protein RHMOL_Rhmol06G0238400 [Rhododendron molle]